MVPALRIVRVGPIATEAFMAIGHSVSMVLGCEAEFCDEILDPSFAYDSSRQQYWSTPILERLGEWGNPSSDRVLGIAEVDLFVPILTFVFGEALLNRPPALISLFRLRPSFYGLPGNDRLLLERAKKEAVHELGHTLGLIHCLAFDCVMRASRVADEIDLKSDSFCPRCSAALTLSPVPTGLET